MCLCSVKKLLTHCGIYCCPSGCQEAEMGQYHSDHSWQSSLASDATACRLQDLSTGLQVSSPAHRSIYLVSMISPVWAVSIHVATCARQVRVTWLCHGPEQLASIHEAFQLLVRDSLPPEIKMTSLTLGRCLRSYYTVTFVYTHCIGVTLDSSLSFDRPITEVCHNFYYKTALNINSVTKLVG